MHERQYFFLLMESIDKIFYFDHSIMLHLSESQQTTHHYHNVWNIGV